MTETISQLFLTGILLAVKWWCIGYLFARGVKAAGGFK